jgi:hypothetical protein
MAQNELVAFIEAARRSGIADTAIAAVLESSGWPRKDVFAAMRAHYEALAGVPVPVRRGVGETARDAFLHLLAFGTLATWALALGGLLFGWVELTWPDRVIDRGGYTQRHVLAGNLASLIVAFPVYLLATRQALREKRDSAVRRWLTWTALLIAAGIVIGDVIAVLAALLRGETTVRFLLKASIVFAVAAGIFWFYLSGLRETGVRARHFAVVSAVAVGLALVAGFAGLGSPAAQRMQEADRRRIQHLRDTAALLQGRRSLPEELPATQVDPVTGQRYEYHRLDGTRYELCATFDAAAAEPAAWAHGAGRHCFPLDAAASRIP